MNIHVSAGFLRLALSGLLAPAAFATVSAQAAENCSEAAMSSVLSSYAKGLKLDLPCSLEQLSSANPTCGEVTPRIAKPQEDLAATITATCAAPNEGNALCASIAAYRYGDVIEGALHLRSPTYESDPGRRRCRRAIVVASAKLAGTSARLLRTCNAKAQQGDPGYGPAGSACTDSAGNMEAEIAALEQRVRDQMARRCGGADRAFGGADDFDPQDDLRFPSACEGGPACTATLDGLAELADCAICIVHQSVDQAIAGAMALPLQPATECEVNLTHAWTLIARGELSIRAECERDVLQTSDHEPCPDFETQQTLVLSATAPTNSVVASCGTLDPQDDLGFASSCPAVGSCGSIDVGGLPGMLDCLRCVTAERTQLIVSSVYPVSEYEPDSLRRECRQRIGRVLAISSTSLAGRKLRRVETCGRAGACGQTSAACPDPLLLHQMDRYRTRAFEDIQEDCAGLDPQDLGFDISCPDVFTCGGQETDSLEGLFTCLACISEAAADDLYDFYVPGP